MNEQTNLAEVNQDGELTEDSLYEWNGDEWVPVEHEPYSGGGLSWWTPDNRRTFNAQRDAENEKADRMVELIVRVISFIRTGLMMLGAIVVVGLFLWICFGPL